MVHGYFKRLIAVAACCVLAACSATQGGNTPSGAKAYDPEKVARKYWNLHRLYLGADEPGKAEHMLRGFWAALTDIEHSPEGGKQKAENVFAAITGYSTSRRAFFVGMNIIDANGVLKLATGAASIGGK